MDLSEEVEVWLQNKEYDKLLEVIFNPENIPKLQTFGMDLITRLCEFGLPYCPDMEALRACQDMLMHVVRCVRPKEALISLLEQAEIAVHSTPDHFSSLLAPLQFVMLNLPKKREHSFSWVLSILNSHMKSQHSFPTELKSKLIQGKDALLLEEEPKVKGLLRSYMEYCNFYEPFVRQFYLDRNAAMASNDEDAKQSIHRQQEILRDHLVQLLGDPLIHIDLHFDEKLAGILEDTSQSKVRSDARIIAERLMAFLRIVDQHPEHYYEWVSRKIFLGRSNLSKKPVYCGDDDGDDTDDEFVVDFSSVVNYNYLIFCESMNPDMVPSVLSPTYILLSAVRLMFMSEILSDNKASPNVVLKCLCLTRTLLSKIDDSVPGLRFEAELLETNVMSDFVVSIAHHTVFCEESEIRKLGLQVLKEIMWKFEPKGRYDFILFVNNRVEHDGVKGYVTTQLKDCVRIALDKGSKEMLEFFTGKRLYRLMKLTCLLKDGPTTDLMENKEQIFSALNLLLYVFLRDKKNQTGIFQALPEIEAKLFEPLFKALELSRAHVQLRLRELEDPTAFEHEIKEQMEMAKKMDMVINDEVQTPETIKTSMEERKSVLKQSLATFDFMNGVLARVNEIAEAVKKSKKVEKPEEK